MIFDERIRRPYMVNCYVMFQLEYVAMKRGESA